MYKTNFYVVIELYVAQRQINGLVPSKDVNVWTKTYAFIYKYRIKCRIVSSNTWALFFLANVTLTGENWVFTEDYFYPQISTQAVQSTNV